MILVPGKDYINICEKLKPHQRLKGLISLVMNKALLTNEARLKRDLSSYNFCPVCRNHPETILHILRYCEKTKDMWLSVGQGLIGASFFHLNLECWLEENLLNETCRSQGVNWPLMFITRCDMACIARTY